MKTETEVWAFFYGSYINMDVLAEVDLSPARWEVAELAGFDLRIAPRANLLRAKGAHVFGILATATHAELARLYEHSTKVLGETYYPEAVLAQTREGLWRPALCYIAPDMAEKPADRDYVNRIVNPARKYGFPDWYVAKIESFAG